MPSYKSAKGYTDIFHAITADAHHQMNDAVLAAYEQKLAELSQEQGDVPGESMAAPAQAEKGQVMQM